MYDPCHPDDEEEGDRLKSIGLEMAMDLSVNRQDSAAAIIGLQEADAWGTWRSQEQRMEASKKTW